jgi:hypothetical protein
VDGVFVLVERIHQLRDALAELEGLLRLAVQLVGEGEGHIRVEVRQLAQPFDEDVGVVAVVAEDVAVGEESHGRAALGVGFCRLRGATGAPRSYF